MKIVISFFVVISTMGCTNFHYLNKKIYEVQKEAILNSPYKSASGLSALVDIQKAFRTKGLPKLISNKLFATNASADTIYLIETFDVTCLKCPSDWIKVLLKDTIYFARREILGHKGGVVYEVETVPFNVASKNNQYESGNSELIEIVAKIRKGEPWLTNSLQYGSDNCNDGDHTLVTLIYPNRKMEAMYVRCWMPSLYRNRK